MNNNTSDNIKNLKLRIKKINVLLEQMGEYTQEGDFVFEFYTKKIGDFISIKSNNGVEIILKKIGQNIYEVVNNGKSIKLLEGDIVKIDDSKIINQGDEINMSIFRKIGMDYEIGPISSIN